VSDQQADPRTAAPPLARSDIRLIMIGLMFVMMLAALETTIIAPALPTIGRELGNVEYLPWVVTVYLLVMTALTPLCGRLADIHGRRIVILGAAGAFIAGSVVCANATSMTMLILGRGIQGIGGGGIFAMTQTIIGDIVPPPERARYQIYTSTVWLLANMLGPLLGGFFAQHLHWSMIFWINAPLGLLALAIVAPRLALLPRNERKRKLDVTGALLMMVATVLLMLTVSWGGSRYPWTSPALLSLAAGALVAWLLLVARLLTAAEPLIPIAVLSNQVVRMAAMSSACAIGAYIGLAVYLPVYLQTITGLGVANAGLAMIPLMVFTSAGAAIGAVSMRRMLHFRIPPLVGLATAGLAIALMALWAAEMSLMTVLILTSIVATGIGTMFPLVAVTLQSVVARHDLGSTMALLVFLRSLGQALGVAMLGAIMLGVAGADAIEQVGARSPADVAALERAFSYMFAVSAAGFAVSVVLLWRMQESVLPGYGRDNETLKGRDKA